MLQLVRRTPATVGYASPEEGDKESQNASKDGDQCKCTSGLDVRGHGAGDGVSLALHLPCGLQDTVQPQTFPHLQVGFKKTFKLRELQDFIYFHSIVPSLVDV